MKKILLMLVALLAIGTGTGHAQSANRSGFTVDFTAGFNLGYIYKEYEKIPDDNSWRDYSRGKITDYRKGGFEIALGVGYKVKMGKHWAYHPRIIVRDNLFMPSNVGLDFQFFNFMYTGPEMAKGRSIFVNLGFGTEYYYAKTYQDGYTSSRFCMPVEAEVGLNLTRRLSLGLVGSIRPILEPGYWRDYDHNGLLALRLGYRF